MTAMVNRKIELAVLSAVLLIFFSGCIAQNGTLSKPSAYNAPPTLISQDGNYWWRCRFKIVWPENTRADHTIDLLLAHAVVQPVLKKHNSDIPYWRFHRRSARDGIGHQFTFLFYSKPQIASSLYAEIDGSANLKKFREANLVEKVMMEDPANPQSPNIQDTSDPHWSSEVQRNWPAFIMGASAMWLGLIEDLMPDASNDSKDTRQLLEEYREVDAKISVMWRDEGQHALLHHLSAVFGYKPMLIKKEISF